MKSDPLFMAFDLLIGGPLIAISAVLLALLFGLALLGATGRVLVLGLLPPQKSLKSGAPRAALSASHH